MLVCRETAHRGTKKNKDEAYRLTSQIRRCAISIPSNIAEGYGRNSTNEYLRFLRIATGSLYELQTQIEIYMNLYYLNRDEFGKLSMCLCVFVSRQTNVKQRDNCIRTRMLVLPCY